MKNETILKVENLKQHFKIGVGRKAIDIKAVDGVSFEVKKGEVFSLVGESGCGKTTTGRSLIGLYEITNGKVTFMDHVTSVSHQDLLDENKQIKKQLRKDLKELKASDSYSIEKENELKENAHKIINDNLNTIKEENILVKNKDNKEVMKKMQMIFQDPIASLNPRMTVKEIIAEGLRIQGIKDEAYIDERVVESLNKVGLLKEHANRYPHEFSGGQRQRIGIARALIVDPEFIIADEPISALDISIQAQVINLLNDLRNELGITILFIAHDLSVVKYFSDRVAVMYFGKIVEMGDKNKIFNNPLHPYTKALLSAIPTPDPMHEKTKSDRLIYDPRVHDYSTDKPEMRKIDEDHFIYANEKEFEEYKKQLND